MYTLNAAIGTGFHFSVKGTPKRECPLHATNVRLRQSRCVRVVYAGALSECLCHGEFPQRFPRDFGGVFQHLRFQLLSLLFRLVILDSLLGYIIVFRNFCLRSSQRPLYDDFKRLAFRDFVGFSGHFRCPSFQARMSAYFTPSPPVASSLFGLSRCFLLTNRKSSCYTI